MTISKKKIYVIVLVIIFLMLGCFLLQWWAKNQIENLLSKKLPSQISLNYSDLDINILMGNVSLYNSTLHMRGIDLVQNHTLLELKSLHLKGVGYWDLMFNETISINHIQLENPKIKHYPYIRKASKESKKPEIKKEEDGFKFLKFDELTITEGSIHVMKQGRDSVKTSVLSYNLKISDSKIDLNQDRKTPIIYNSYKFEAENILLVNNAFETIGINRLRTSETDWLIEDLKITPKYSKKALSLHLNKERDHITLHIPKLKLKNLNFDLFGERFGVTVEKLNIHEPNFEIYRDKLVTDDLTIKSLYSKSLRELNFDLAINETEINNGYISYAELVAADTHAGKLFFDSINAKINDITNKKDAEKTKITVQSKLMGEAPLELNWNFDVNDASDAFDVSGSIQNLSADGLNSFFKPNLNAIAEGSLQQLYFTFYGNSISSQGEMKMKYDDFKFSILRKDKSKVNKVLTAIGNLFISKDSESNSEKFRFGGITAERDNTKSFFNYLWINVKSGLVSTLIGDGKA